ncbi:hypothetical protein KDA_43470 [Dictyobacter alpinus]|uniref:VOC domain-containing protein n=1 Tax=Dictyobacter alpinus TaxID=2014873 RepID=A0A402BBV0_9CHLR|nr:VOC family protein [Dictyobacter alpinus]GCE28863.1 hypothetical protein KDA_43470 [Dictyobacter alpinus]
MITKVGAVCVAVSNQDEALDFYVNKLGFEKRSDVPMGDDGRWIEVAPAGAATTIVLEKNQNNPGQRMGTFIGFIVHTRDIQATCSELKDRGVRFTAEPKQEFWGYWAQFVDQDNNEYGLFENKES